MLHSRRTVILFRIAVPLIPVPVLLILAAIWTPGLLHTRLEQTGFLMFIVAAIMVGAAAFSHDDDKYMQKELKEQAQERKRLLEEERARWAAGAPSDIQDTPRNDAGSRSW